MKIIKMLFCSMKVALILMAVYAIGCGIATFIEKFDGTMAARAYVYDAFWFELLHLWLVASLIGCFFVSKSWERQKYAALLLHASFIVIIVGAGITRYFGFEGVLSLREGQSTNLINTNTHYIFIRVENPDGEGQYVKIPTYIDDKINRPIHRTFSFFDKPFIIHTHDLVDENVPPGMFLLNADVTFLDDTMHTQILRDGNELPTKDTITTLRIGDYKVVLAWAVDAIPLPFWIKLNTFELERYPGSHSPASYASQVEVLDDDKTMPFRIFMNNVLDYGGYRFFQSSYHPDERGSILSVNNDPGKVPTYIGYAMLILSVIWLLFDRHGRFVALGRFLKTQQCLSIAIICASCLIAMPQITYAMPQDSKDSISTATDSTDSTESVHTEDSQQNADIPPMHDIPQMIAALKQTDIDKAFDRILVQDFGGRTKPIHTLANDYIHKITKQRTFKGLNPTQVFLGMIFYPQEWQSIQMIAVKSAELKAILGLNENQKYIAYVDVFADGQYILQNYVEEANRKNPALRSTFEKDVINVDERINYAFLIYTGQVLRIFPDSKAENQQWLFPLEAISSAFAQGDMEKATQLLSIYKLFAEGVESGIYGGGWEDANEAIAKIHTFQQDNADSTLISQVKIDSEILLNTYNPFYQLTYPYILVSVIFFIIVLWGIVKNKPMRVLVYRVFYGLLCALFVLHTAALALRWYVGGHAPWSNAYESMLYIAWAAILAGVVCFRRSSLALCAASFLSGMTLLVANLGSMDPQIGNLVPVLKSYWLNIHVSVITASYGFLGLCFMLGLITLLMFILRSPRLKFTPQTQANIDSSILSLTALNEMSMILGLFLLTVGNFLGGIWANESWGRYWGWDAKETWSLISIGVYAIILHLRFVFKANIPFIFTSASVIGFFSILMTYFGVNYYLSGMHSYAAGEAAPVPLWAKIMVICIFIFIVIAGRNAKLQMPKIA